MNIPRIFLSLIWCVLLAPGITFATTLILEGTPTAPIDLNIVRKFTYFSSKEKELKQTKITSFVVLEDSSNSDYSFRISTIPNPYDKKQRDYLVRNRTKSGNEYCYVVLADWSYLRKTHFECSQDNQVIAQQRQKLPELRDQCERGGGTWDRDRDVPDGECIPDSSKACEARGGAWTRVCMFGHLACVTKYEDAGKECTDSSQCKGGCRDVGKPPDENGLIRGECRRDDNPCGCFMGIANGRKTGGYCKD